MKFIIRIRNRISFLLVLVGIIATPVYGQSVNTDKFHQAPAPLYRDPVYDGPADPALIWNRHEKSWWMLYTQRRANIDVSAVAFAFGTCIGVASSRDNGQTWVYRGCLKLDFEKGDNTYWAPEVVYQDGVYHLFVTYIQGIRSHWGGQAHIVHYTSKDLWKWNFEGPLKLSSNHVIDPALFQLPDGNWRLWWKDKNHGSAIMTAQSNDLSHWQVDGQPAINGSQEGPVVFQLGQWKWMLTDEWQGMRVYRSKDAKHWRKQDLILGGASKRPGDRPSGSHGDVVTLAAPICAPSRASLMLGLSQGHANVRNNQFDKRIEDNHTLANVLKKAGYATAAIGKWGLQGDPRYSKNGGDWPARPRNRGFDYFLGYMRHSDGHEHYPKEGLYTGRKQVWKNDSVITPKLDKTYTADLWTAAAKKWITDHQRGKQADQPFFMYLAYDTPHAVLELPTQVYPSGAGLNGGMQWIGRKGHMINTASDSVDSWIHPDYAQSTYDDDNDSSVPWPDVYKRYATATRRIDSGVGDIMQLLRDLNIDDNTLVIFTSDNGPTRASYLNRGSRKVNKNKSFHPNNPTFFRSYGPFDGMKRDTYEGGIRMPTIAWWKGHIEAGRVIDSPSIQYDWLPTFADMAGLPPPANTDGVSLLPTLTGKGKQRDGLIYTEYYNSRNIPKFKDYAPRRRGAPRQQMQMIRIDKYVGVRYNIQSASDDFEIYNVKNDPSERYNLAKDPEKNPQIHYLQQRMKKKVLRVRMPDSSARRPYDKAFIPAVNKDSLQAGISWKGFKGTFPWVPKVAGMTPDTSGQMEKPEVSGISSNQRVLYFSGYLSIPENGKYTFSLKADTGALLRIHDATVIDADYGYQSGKERSGSLKLEQGLHPFRLYYLHKPGKKPLLGLAWSGPEIKKQPIPDDVFFHNGINQ